MTSRTIIFFGNERLATGVETRLPVLSALIANGYRVAAIVIAPQKPLPRSRKTRPLEVVGFAQHNNVPLLELESLKASVGPLSKFNATAAILAAYGKIVPQTVIDIFPKGIINIHPSLLPSHRGPTPIESVILNDERRTGVSLMQLSAAMDAGPIFDQTVIELNGSESKSYLANTLGNLGADLLIKHLPAIIDGRLTAKPQPSNPVSYDSKILSDQSKLDFNKSAEVLAREIRAYLGWPRSRSEINSKGVIITAAHAINPPLKKPLTAGKLWTLDRLQLGIATSKGILEIDRLIPSGGKEMSGAEYLRGYLAL
jgi:methionyl-tRNA formyltransferase